MKIFEGNPIPEITQILTVVVEPFDGGQLIPQAIIAFQVAPVTGHVKEAEHIDTIVDCGHDDVACGGQHRAVHVGGGTASIRAAMYKKHDAEVASHAELAQIVYVFMMLFVRHVNVNCQTVEGGLHFMWQMKIAIPFIYNLY